MNKAKAKDDNQNVITENRKARFNYAIEETVEAGVMLQGTEVKSLRAGQGQLTDSYAIFRGYELWLLNAHIPEYSHGTYANHEPMRSRKLLLHKHEIEKLKVLAERQGTSLIPLKMYWKNGKVKVLLGVAKGKKMHDKRDTIQDRDWAREQHRLLKARNNS